MSGQSDMLQVEGINSKGFGIIPKLVMQDDQLSLAAKAIYGYFCSYAGAGNQAFPRVTRIMKDLGLCKSSYYKHFNQLVEHGYVKTQQTYKNGRLSHNIYTLVQVIQCPKKQDTVLQEAVLQDAVFQDTTKNNSIENKQFSKISQSCLSEPKRSTKQKIDGLTEQIRENIEYDIFRSDPYADMSLVDEIVSIIIDVMVSDSQYVRVDGEDRPRELVQHVLMELTFGCIEHVINGLKAQGERIKKKRQYILTMLYNSKHELNADAVNAYYSDLGGL